MVNNLDQLRRVLSEKSRSVTIAPNLIRIFTGSIMAKTVLFAFDDGPKDLTGRVLVQEFVQMLLANHRRMLLTSSSREQPKKIDSAIQFTTSRL